MDPEENDEVGDEPAKKQPLPSASEIDFDVKECPPKMWNDYNRKNIKSSWGENKDRTNWTTLETIAAVRAALHTSQYNQNEASEELCRQALNNYMTFYREATEAKEGGPVFRTVEGDKCAAGYDILPEHVFNMDTDPSYEASTRVRGEAKKHGNNTDKIKGLAIWKRYKEVRSVVQNTILPLQKEVLNDDAPGSGCNLVDKIHGEIRRKYFESTDSKTSKHSKWETWTDAIFEAYRVFGILGERRAPFMRPTSEKTQAQTAKYPSVKEQREEKKRKFDEMNTPLRAAEHARFEKTQMLMVKSLKVKDKAARTAKFKAIQDHLKGLMEESKFTMQNFKDDAELFEQAKETYAQSFVHLRQLQCEPSPPQTPQSQRFQSEILQSEIPQSEIPIRDSKVDDGDTSPTPPQSL